MYSFYLDKVLLPITPQKLQVKIKGNNKTLSLANDSEINFLRSPGLTEISFEMTLPMYSQYSFAQEYRRPDYYLGKLEALMTGKKPFRFIVSRISPSGALLYDSNMLVSLESYSTTEDATKGPDIAVSISLKQYIPFATKTGAVVTTTDSTGNKTDTLLLKEPERETSGAPDDETYTIAENDMLYTIAKKKLGSGDLQPILLSRNPRVLPNAWDLKKGVTLRLK